MIDNILAKYLDDRESLTPAEFALLIQALKERPELARQVKELLIVDDLVSRNMSVDRMNFQAQIAQRLRESESGADLTPRIRENLRLSSRKRRGLSNQASPWMIWGAVAACLIISIICFVTLSSSKKQSNETVRTHSGQRDKLSSRQSDAPAPSNKEVSKPPAPRPQAPELAQTPPPKKIEPHSVTPSPKSPSEEQPKVVEVPQPQPPENPEQPSPVTQIEVATVDIEEGNLIQSGKPLKKGDAIYAGFPIETGDNGRGKLILADQSELYLNTGTRVEFANSEGRTTVAMNHGELFAQMRKQKVPFVVRTPHGDVEVKGTELDVKAGDSATTVAVISGKVECKNDRGRTEVNTAQQAIVGKDQAPTSPKSIDNAAILGWVRGLLPTPPSPVGYWTFEGGAASDKSGNGNNGTLHDGPLKTMGKVGDALSFDGVNDYVSIPDSATLSPTAAISIEAWIKPTSLPAWAWIIGKATYPSFNYGLLIDDKGRVYFSVMTTSGERFGWKASRHTLTAGTWYHVVGTYDGAVMNTYVNGSNTGMGNSLSYDTNLPILDNAGDLNIGRNAGGNYFPGVIDEVRIYNKALTVGEVLALYTETKPLK